MMIMSEEEKTCDTCMYGNVLTDTPCHCCFNYELWVRCPYQVIAELKDELALWKIESYFLFKTNVTTESVCYNAESKLCAKCKQPECGLAGWVKKLLGLNDYWRR